mmetsp:Transcript_94997/g.212678  ORF Transcript_94997/g.212678 Transcript_94997/m.212678 type:complete len:247 (-) Transcript_94997:286-1026(-)
MCALGEAWRGAHTQLVWTPPILACAQLEYWPKRITNHRTNHCSFCPCPCPCPGRRRPCPCPFLSSCRGGRRPRHRSPDSLHRCRHSRHRPLPASRSQLVRRIRRRWRGGLRSAVIASRPSSSLAGSSSCLLQGPPPSPARGPCVAPAWPPSGPFPWAPTDLGGPSRPCRRGTAPLVEPRPTSGPGTRPEARRGCLLSWSRRHPCRRRGQPCCGREDQTECLEPASAWACPAFAAEACHPFGPTGQA